MLIIIAKVLLLLCCMLGSMTAGIMTERVPVKKTTDDIAFWVTCLGSLILGLLAAFLN